MFVNCLGTHFTFVNKELFSAFALKCNFEVVEVTFQDFTQMLAEVPGFDIARMVELKNEAKIPPKMGLACWGMYLCSTGRFLQEANAANWDTSRWRSVFESTRPH